MGGYNGIPDDEDRELGARIGRPPAPSAVPPLTVRPLAPPAAAPAPPAAGSTEDLEAKGQELRMAPKTGPIGGGPQAPPSPTGAQPRTIRSMWHETGNIQSKPLRTLGRIGVGALGALDIAGGGVMEKNAQAQKEKDIQDTQTQATTGETEARTEQAKAAAEKDRAAAEAARNQKTGLTPEELTLHDLMTGNNGQPRMNPDTQQPYTYIEAYQATKQAGQNVKPVKPERPDTPEQQFIDAEMKKGKTLEQAVADYAKASQHPPSEPGSFMPFYDEKGHVTGAWDPKSGRVVKPPGEGLPGNTAQGEHIANQGITMQMRNVAAQASLVHEQMPSVISEIQGMKSELGPIEGRWNEFMQGKIGMNDPKFAGLRTDLLMMSSAVALMHARGRLPENLRAEFDNTINAPKQSAENLVAILNKIDNWTVANMNMMGGGGQGGGKDLGPAPAGKAEDATGTMLDGTKVKVHRGRLVAQ